MKNHLMKNSCCLEFAYNTSGFFVEKRDIFPQNPRVGYICMESSDFPFIHPMLSSPTQFKKEGNDIEPATLVHCTRI